MTLRSVLILLSLCTLICSDSMSHFRDIVSGNIANVEINFSKFNPVIHKFYTHGSERDPPDSVFKGFESCAEQCLLTKFYCRSFMVMALSGEMQCIMDYNLPDNLADYFIRLRTGNPVPSVLVAAYDIKEKIDNVAAITKDPTLLSEDRFHELLRGYGISKSLEEENWDGMVASLKTCATALKLPKSKPKSFRKWLNGVESSYEQLMPVSASKYTNNYEQVRKLPRLGDIPDISVLMFLDLYSRAVNEHTETIYDPREGTLYIDSPNIQLLFISYNKDDYIWAALGNEVETGYVVIGGSKERRNRQDLQKAVIEDLGKAAASFNHDIAKLESRVLHDYHSQLWFVINYLSGFPWSEVSDQFIMLSQDLSKAVPIIHSKSPTLFTQQNRNSFPFKDVQVVTFKE